MAEYIERNRLLTVLDRNFGHTGGADVLKQLIENAPAADVVEVKQGKWYKHDKKTHGDSLYHCSVCERIALTDCGMVWELTPYCPYCGAKMTGEDK